MLRWGGCQIEMEVRKVTRNRVRTYTPYLWRHAERMFTSSTFDPDVRLYCNEQNDQTLPMVVVEHPYRRWLFSLSTGTGVRL